MLKFPLLSGPHNTKEKGSMCPTTCRIIYCSFPMPSSLLYMCPRLFCKFCRKPVGTKQSVITKHLQTALHANNRKAHAAEHKKQSDVYLLVQAQAQTEDSKASRDFSTESRRYQVVEAFMGAGIPLSKIAAYLPLRRVLEVGNQRLASTTTLTEHIPLILKAEKSRIRDELRVGVPVAARINTTIPCSVFFDGATKVCECMAFICRFTFEGL